MTRTITPKLNRSGVATRERLILIARELFVENGFTGTSMTQIAAKADVNHSLLFHHFGSKLNLWLDVKDLIVEEGKKVTIILPSTEQPFSSFLKELMKNTVSFFKNNPDIIRMINWQRLEKATDQDVAFNIVDEAKNWTSTAQHYQTTGEINATIKPEFAMTMVLAIATSIATDPNIFADNKEKREEYVDFCVQRITKSLA